MSKPSIVCVTPSIRPEQMESFRKAWAHLFKKHEVTLITVWDGDDPQVEYRNPDGKAVDWTDVRYSDTEYRDLLCRKTDAIRNLGFVEAARVINPDRILTLDDDVVPPAGSDPIQEHLDVLTRHVPISWMNTALLDFPQRAGDQKWLELTPYLRGFPYDIRYEAPVKVSHGVWVNVPDFDGRTQLELGKCSCNKGIVPKHGGTVSDVPCQKCGGTGYDGCKLPYSLPYFRGPVPKGCYFPFCGMNVMVHKDALPYLYFAPMGPDSGVEGLNRFADIWCGLTLKRQMDALGWAIYTGASTILHTRASDPFKNVEQEKLGIEWNEKMWQIKGSTYGYAVDEPLLTYIRSWYDKANRFRELIKGLQSK